MIFGTTFIFVDAILSLSLSFFKKSLHFNNFFNL